MTRVLVLAGTRRYALKTCGEKMRALLLGLAKSIYYGRTNLTKKKIITELNIYHVCYTIYKHDTIEIVDLSYTGRVSCVNFVDQYLFLGNRARHRYQR